MLQQLDFVSDLAIAKVAGNISKGATHAKMLKDWQAVTADLTLAGKKCGGNKNCQAIVALALVNVTQN